MKTNIHFLIISRPVLLRMRNFLDKSCREIKTHAITFFYFENRAVYEIIWKDIVEPGRPQMRLWRMLLSREVPKATNTHSEHAILITFVLKQWLRQRASILRWACIACLVHKIDMHDVWLNCKPAAGFVTTAI